MKEAKSPDLELLESLIKEHAVNTADSADVPPAADSDHSMDDFDAEPAVLRWWKAGPRRHRPATHPYGPRDNPESDTDSDSDRSDIN